MDLAAWVADCLGPDWPALRDEDRPAFVRLALLLMHVDRRIDEGESTWVADHILTNEGEAERMARRRALDEVRACFADPQASLVFAQRQARALATSPDRTSLLERLGALIAADGALDPREATLWQAITRAATAP